MYSLDEVRNVDPEIAEAIVAEQNRQNDHIELIASENWVSKAVMAAMGSPLTNKYAEGYPGKRYYGGCECVDVVENLARERAKELFGCDYANVQPHSGASANLAVYFALIKPGDTVLKVEHMTVPSKVHGNNAVKDVSFNVRKGEIVCIAGIDGNGQSEFVQGLTGLEKVSGGKILFNGQDITKASIRDRSKMGMSHIPEDRHKHGLVLDYSIEQNMVLQRYWQPEFESFGFIKSKAVREYAERLIEQYDVRSGQGPVTITRSMSGGNQQKAIIAREIDKDPDLLVAVQPTRGLDVGAIEYIHSQLVAQRDKGKAVLLVSLELDEVMDVSDRILVMYEGELVGQLDPKTVSVEELGLYMAGAKRDPVPEEV